MMDAQKSSDLDLAAMRYIAGEMSDDESRRFEARLGEEQAARDAVDFAVRVATASCELPALSQAPEAVRIALWKRAAVAALLILGLGVTWRYVAEQGAAGDSAAVEVSMDAAQTEDLVASWVALGEVDADSSSLFAGEHEDEGAEDDELLADLAVDFDAPAAPGASVAALEAPDWMIQGLK